MSFIIMVTVSSFFRLCHPALRRHRTGRSSELSTLRKALFEKTQASTKKYVTNTLELQQDLKSQKQHFKKNEANKDLKKEARKERNRKYRLDNKEIIDLRIRQYRVDNKEKIKEWQKQYYLKNKEAINERTKRYNEENKEILKELQKQDRLNNKEVIKERNRKYHIKNKEAIRERNRQYHLKNKEAVKERGKQYRLKNQEVIKEFQIRYSVKNKEVMRERVRKYNLKNREMIRVSNRLYHYKMHPIRKNKNWKDLECVRKFLEVVKTSLHLTNPNDWYRVSQRQILQLGGYGLRRTFGSLGNALLLIYPEISWDLSKFSLRGKKSGQKLLCNIMKQVLPENTEIFEDFLHPNLFWDYQTNHKMELDIWIPQYNLALEYQGEQHYYDLRHAFGPMRTRDMYAGRDLKKKEACVVEGITLIAIPFWWDGKLETLTSTLNLLCPQIFPVVDISANLLTTHN